jgi:hypothetical protein
MENVFLENAYVKKIIKLRIALSLFVIAIIEESVYLISNACVMKDFMEKIVKKVYVKIIAMRMELVIKESVYAKQAGERMIVL